MGWSRLERREREREGEPDELLEWCVSESPLSVSQNTWCLGNVKARRATDAIPQRGSAGIISEGNGGLKWRTNFSKTSSERNLHALRLFFCIFHPLSPLLLCFSPPTHTFFSLLPSLFSFFVLRFRCDAASSTKLIFLKIKGRTTLN